jgi:Polysaccharide biosynthesis protein
MSPRQLYQPLRKEMTLGAIWSFVETSGAGLLSFVITMVLARLLGPEHFGVVAIAYAIVAVTQPLFRSGFPTAIIQRYQLSCYDICVCANSWRSDIDFGLCTPRSICYRWRPRCIWVYDISLCFLSGF